MPDGLKNFWQAQVVEVQKNKLRFTAILACLILAILLALSENFSTGEEIDLSSPSPSINDSVEEIAAPVRGENVTEVIGADSAELYIYDPFKVPQKPKPIEPPPVQPVQPEIPPPQPVAQLPEKILEPEIPPLAENFVLHGTAISGNRKSALIQKKSPEENLFVKIGDILGGKKIVDIGEDFVTFDDGERLDLDLGD